MICIAVYIIGTYVGRFVHTWKAGYRPITTATAYPHPDYPEEDIEALFHARAAADGTASGKYDASYDSHSWMSTHQHMPREHMFAASRGEHASGFSA